MKIMKNSNIDFNIDNLKKVVSYLKKTFMAAFFLDAPVSWQMSFQDPATFVMESITDLHHDIMTFLIITIIFITLELVYILVGHRLAKKSTVDILNFSYLEVLNKKNCSNTRVEIIWTLVPCFVLLLIAIPSYALLYTVEDLECLELTVKVIGCKGYWRYEIDYEFRTPGPDSKFIFGKKYFNSVMVPGEDLVQGSYIFSNTDKRLVLPVNTEVGLWISSNDVLLHSWTVPPLGVKIDPGVFESCGILINRPGVFYGYGEASGVKHSSMPIVIHAVPEKEFVAWLLDPGFHNLDIRAYEINPGPYPWCGEC